MLIENIYELCYVVYEGDVGLAQMYWMGRLERQIMQRFLDLKLLEGEYRFGVLLDTPNSRRIAARGGKFYLGEAKLAMFKIDAVVETPAAIWILQVSDMPRDSAISKLLKYRLAYKEQYKPTKMIRLGLIAAVDRPEYHPLMLDLGIRWWIV